jgi:PHD/YefM family antitoxin component YafN of YafNO toxin-antitoxin module
MAIAKTEKDMIVIPREEYEEMRETLEILSNPEMTKRILESIKEAKEGKTITEEEFSRKFRL